MVTKKALGEDTLLNGISRFIRQPGCHAMTLLEKGQHGYYIGRTTGKESRFLKNIVNIGVFLHCKANGRFKESTEEVHG
jgi:hypothetical protein